MAASHDRVPIAGVDGCRSGWVVVTAETEPGGDVLAVEVVAGIVGVIDAVRAGELAVVAVDMPIGLPSRGMRLSDRQARRQLGPRRSTVFPTPPRPLLGSSTHAEAVATGRALDGRGISIQAFNLLGRIEELDAAMDPSLCDRIVEAHPESGFAEMAGAPLASSKRGAAGREDRLALLAVHGLDVDVVEARSTGAAPDDVLDAAANAWTARRWFAGDAIVLGDGELDGRGLPMRIVV